MRFKRFLSPGEFVGAKPKAYNRHFAINIGTSGAPEILEICHGISSRGNNISEDTEEYNYMCGRGSSESEITEQTVVRTFNGNRFIGDPAQDAIFIDRMYDMNKREVEYYDWYDNMPSTMLTEKGNGWKGTGTIVITDDGSGDAPARETISFNLNQSGAPTRGTVTKTEDSITFAPLGGA